MLSLFSCKKAEEEVLSPAKMQKTLPKMEDTFPFSETTKIEIISYPVRYEWDTIRNGERKVMASLVENKQFQPDTLHIKDRVILNNKFTNQLFKSFFTKYEGCTVAACFDPRHAILFYNEKREIIAYLEVCLDCGNSQSSGNFKYDDLCEITLAELFEQAGIKYFGE